LTGSTLTVATTTPGASFPLGASASVPDIAPLASATVTLDLALDKSVAPRSPLALDVTLANPTSCEGMVASSLSWRVNYDELPATSATDDVESEHTVWTPGGDMAAAKVWARREVAPLQHAWHGVDFGAVSDTWLASPDL